MIVEFRRRTLLPLDDVPGCLRGSTSTLTRSSLRRCLERHGPVSSAAWPRLPERPDQASRRGKFAETAIGCPHVDLSELRLAQGKLNMVLAIDRVSKFTDAEFRDDADKMNGAGFLQGVVEAFPDATHTVPTDNGTAFAGLPKNRNGPTRRHLGAPIFDRACNDNGTKHKLAKPCHPWTNDQAERMNRTAKEATIKAFPCPDLESLKAIRWRTPFEAVCHAWTTTPDILNLNPRHLTPGLNRNVGPG